MDLSDRQLLQKFHNESDQQAFYDLVKRHLPLVHSVALRVTRNPSSAEEVSQLIFSRLATKHALIREDVTFAAWLHRATRLEALDLIRSEARRRKREQIAAEYQSISQKPSWEEIAPVLDEVIDHLSAQDRSLILTRYFQGESLANIGRPLGLSEDATRMRVNRALEKLRALLAKRGVTTTASALALSLPAHAVTPVSASLSSSISVAALTGKAAFASQPLITLSFFTMTTKTIMISGAILAGVLTGVWIVRSHDPSTSRTTSLPTSNNAQTRSSPGLSISQASPTPAKTTFRKQAPKEWKLPFRLAPRIDTEKSKILDGDVGAHLLNHPGETDLLVAWASRDPHAAIAWLEANGEITVDDIGFYNTHLAAIAAGLFSHGGMEEMQDFLKQHHDDPLLPPKYQDGHFEENVWFLLAREDTGQEALEYLRAHPEETTNAGAFLSSIPQTDRMLAALDYLQAKGIEGNIDYWHLRERIGKDGNLIADWAANSRPDMLEEVLLGWGAENPAQLQQWINANSSRPNIAPVLKSAQDLLTEDRKHNDKDKADDTADEE